MGKYAKYGRKYQSRWESLAIFKDWLQQDCNNQDRGYCKVCQTSLRGHRKDLEDHSRTRKHQLNLNAVKPGTSQTTLNEHILIVKNENKDVEMKIAVYIALHSSIKSVDDLSELLESTGIANNNLKIKLHRTKCTMIIKNVISEGLKFELIKDIGQKKYSLIIDESTDVSVCKYLCMCIQLV